MTRVPDRRRAVARLALLGSAIIAAFVTVTLLGVSPTDARHWVAEAGALGPLLFVLVAAVLGLALFPGQLIATAAGALFGALTGIPIVLGAALIAAGVALLVARRIGADALLALLSPGARPGRAGSPTTASAPCSPPAWPRASLRASSTTSRRSRASAPGRCSQLSRWARCRRRSRTSRSVAHSRTRSRSAA